MRMVWIVILVSALLAGCQQPKPPIPVAPPANSTDLVLRLRPVIADPEPDSVSINERLMFATKVYTKAGIRIDVLPYECLDDSDWVDIRDHAQWVSLCRDAKARAETRGELTFYFVRYLLGHGGLSNYPSNLPGSWAQRGVGVAHSSCMNAVAHELGHAFGLLHTWEDGLSIDQNDCGVPEKYCLTMSYCCNRDQVPQCDGKWLVQSEIDTVRAWATASPRDLVVSGKAPELAAKRRVLVYTASTRPAE
jgi:hypothetical protein